MGFRPFDKASIHRKDNDQGYSPENCVWADNKTQARERTNAVKLTYNNETLHIMEWAERTGHKIAHMRKWRQQGWSDAEIIEGRRTISPKSVVRDSAAVFRFTPWPRELALEWEKTYQKKHYAGEHRLTFALRYCRSRVGDLQDQIEGLFNPDDSHADMPPPNRTPEKQSQWLKLNNDYERWIGYLKDFQRKASLCRSEVNPSYADVPPWAERQLLKLTK